MGLTDVNVIIQKALTVILGIVFKVLERVSLTAKLCMEEYLDCPDRKDNQMIAYTAGGGRYFGMFKVCVCSHAKYVVQESNVY